jgi:glycerol uptake facilitator-like aquaporin
MNAAIVVEFLGTALLISAIAFGGSPLMVIAAVAVAIAIGAPVSGAHFNPAVTLFKHIDGKISHSTGLAYVAAQLAAALCVGFLRRVL